MVVAHGTLNGKEVLNEYLVKLSMKNHTEHLNEPRGLGWDYFLSDNRKNELIGHLGFTGTSI